MAVQVATLDILTHRAHFEPEVARAIGDAIDLEMNTSRDNLATKHELKEEINLLRYELRKEMAELRAELKADMAELRAELKAEIAELRTELRTSVAELRAEMANLRAEYKRDLADCKSDMIRWMFSALIGQTMLLVGIMYFMLQHLR